MRPDPFAWTPHPEAVVALALLVVAYALIAGRRGRPWLFAAAALLLLATAITPLESLTYHLLTAHLLQNVVLAEWAPALLVAALPPTLALRVHPALALSLWLGNYVAWHVPPVYDAALRHPDTLLHLEHATYLATGVLLWWPVFHGGLSYGARAGYLLLAFVLASPIGLLLTFLPDPAYDFYAGGFEPWNLSALTDQRIAGVTMAAEQGVVFFALFLRAFARFLSEEEMV
ncbi:MAG: cytochrome c oxidase assembly protein [Gaiellaceae bacterium]